MCDHKSQRIICQISVAMDHLKLNQGEMVARAKQTNKILKSMQKVTEELKEENSRLYHENTLLRGDNGFQRVHQPIHGMVHDDHSEDDDLSITEEDDDVDDVFGKTTCWGCLHNQPNQLSHMDIGGCLHCAVSDDEDTEYEREMTGLNTIIDEMEIDD